MDLKLFTSTFIMIFLAELPDKTAFATIMLAAKGRHGPVFIGVALAFFIQTLIAVTIGGFLSKLPTLPVKASTAILFLYFAWSSWTKRNETADESKDGEPDSKSGYWKALLHSFLVVFIAEFGDMTQLTTAALAAKTGDSLTIFPAALLALWSVTAIAVLAGTRITRMASPRQLHLVASIVFTLVGLFIGGECFYQAIR
jgi:putative Ca2+/H+ antiporter (TMEM165/GDT1 family)